MAYDGLRLIDYEAKTVTKLPCCKRCGVLARSSLCDCIPEKYYHRFNFCDCGELADYEVEPPMTQIHRQYTGTWVSRRRPIPESSQTRGKSLSESSQTPESKKGTQDSSAKTPVAPKKAKIVADGKKGGHTDSPHTAKKAKTLATDKSKAQTPKSASKGAPQSPKAKHSAGK